MKELGEAINQSLSDSEPISEVIARIKAGGYDVFLVLEATIGVNRREDDEDPSPAFKEPSLTSEMTSQDLKFLKSLRIKVDQG